MATSYPTTLACPKLTNFSISVSSGVLRSSIPGSQSQRRAYETMPHTFRLSFAMSVTEWATWQSWVESNAYGWFEMDLPSMYAGKLGLKVTPTLIRFVSAVSASAMTEKHVELTVVAEMAPSMIKKYKEAV